MLKDIQIGKPWGFYRVHYKSEICVVKTIFVNPNERLSLQKHNLRSEYWVIKSGEGLLTLDTEVTFVKAGSTVNIPVGKVHSINNTGKQILVIEEVQYGELCDENDIVRYEDKYGRQTT